MAFDQSIEFPGKYGAPTPSWPYGVPRDVTVSGDGTGSPWNSKSWGDLYGLITSILWFGSQVPNGAVDNVDNPQLLETLNRCMPSIASIQISKRVPADNGDKIVRQSVIGPNFLGRAIKILDIKVDAAAWGDLYLRDSGGNIIANINEASYGASPDMANVTISDDEPDVGKLYIEEYQLNASNFEDFGLYITYITIQA